MKNDVKNSLDFMQGQLKLLESRLSQRLDKLESPARFSVGDVVWFHRGEWKSATVRQVSYSGGWYYRLGADWESVNQIRMAIKFSEADLFSESDVEELRKKQE